MKGLGKGIAIFLGILFFSQESNAQPGNMISNPFFSTCDHCDRQAPWTIMELKNNQFENYNDPPDWICPTSGSPDIQSLEVKSRLYAGGIAVAEIDGILYSEYLTNILIDTLKPLSIYELHFFIRSYFQSDLLDEIQFKFHEDIIERDKVAILHLEPDLSSPDGQYFYSRWTSVDLEYIACGHEKYMTVGKLLPWESSEWKEEFSNSTDSTAYWLLDNFQLNEVGFVPHGLPDTMVYCGDTTFNIIFDTLAYDWSWNDLARAALWVEGPGQYFLRRACAGSNRFRIDTVVVIEEEDLFIALPDDTILCTRAEQVLRVDSFDHSKINWSTGETTRSIKILEGGLYKVSVSSPCQTVTDSVEVIFAPSDYCDSVFCRTFYPNTITPNADGINDCFEIFSQGQLIDLKIFDRWGELVFSGIDNQWCGEDFKNQELLPGVYVYKAQLKCDVVGPRVRYGSITLIR